MTEMTGPVLPLTPERIEKVKEASTRLHHETHYRMTIPGILLLSLHAAEAIINEPRDLSIGTRTPDTGGVLETLVAGPVPDFLFERSLPHTARYQYRRILHRVLYGDALTAYTRKVGAELPGWQGFWRGMGGGYNREEMNNKHAVLSLWRGHHEELDDFRRDAPGSLRKPGLMAMASEITKEADQYALERFTEEPDYEVIWTIPDKVPGTEGNTSRGLWQAPPSSWST